MFNRLFQITIVGWFQMNILLTSTFWLGGRMFNNEKFMGSGRFLLSGSKSKYYTQNFKLTIDDMIIQNNGIL